MKENIEPYQEKLNIDLSETGALLPGLLEQLESGQTIRVLKDGRVVAVIYGPEFAPESSGRNAAARFNALRKARPVLASFEELQKWKREGRA